MFFECLHTKEILTSKSFLKHLKTKGTRKLQSDSKSLTPNLSPGLRCWTWLHQMMELAGDPDMQPEEDSKPTAW